MAKIGHPFLLYIFPANFVTTLMGGKHPTKHDC